MVTKYDVKPFKVAIHEADLMDRPIHRGNSWTPSHDRFPVVGAATAVSVFPGELFKPPMTWTSRYFNLQQNRVHADGGHFAPLQVPHLFVDDVRTFFATHRTLP